MHQEVEDIGQEEDSSQEQGRRQERDTDLEFRVLEVEHQLRGPSQVYHWEELLQGDHLVLQVVEGIVQEEVGIVQEEVGILGSILGTLDHRGYTVGLDTPEEGGSIRHTRQGTVVDRQAERQELLGEEGKLIVREVGPPEVRMRSGLVQVVR